MSLTKKILFGEDSADEEIRQIWRDAAAEHVAALPFAIQTRRKNRIGHGSYWDPFWPSAVSTALKHLGIESIVLNGRHHVRTQEQARAARDSAEAIHKKKIARWRERLPAG